MDEYMNEYMGKDMDEYMNEYMNEYMGKDMGKDMEKDMEEPTITSTDCLVLKIVESDTETQKSDTELYVIYAMQVQVLN